MPTSVPIDVSWGQLISVMAVTFGAVIGIFTLLLRTLLKSMRANMDTKFANLHALVVSLDKRDREQSGAHDRLRDKWEDFLREYLKIDSTRGQKIDALFRVVDRMQTVVDKLPTQMNSKIEEAFSQSMSELKLYARDQIELHTRRGRVDGT